MIYKNITMDKKLGLNFREFDIPERDILYRKNGQPTYNGKDVQIRIRMVTVVLITNNADDYVERIDNGKTSN
jgi:hypothetical protein